MKHQVIQCPACSLCSSQDGILRKLPARRPHPPQHSVNKVTWPVKNYGAREILIHAGKSYQDVMTIISGVMATVATLEDGRIQILGLHFQGEIVGRADGRSAQHDIISLTDIELRYCSVAQFMTQLDTDAAFRQRYLNLTGTVIDDARRWMITLGRKTAQERLATLLIILALKGRKTQPPLKKRKIEVAIPLSREEIGNYLGLTISTVSRRFTQLKREGLITIDGRRLFITNFQALLDQTGDSSLPIEVGDHFLESR